MVSDRSLGNLALGPAARKKTGDRTKTLLRLPEYCRWLLRAIGGGNMTKGAENVGEMTAIIADAYPYLPEHLAARVEALNLIEVCENAPDTIAIRDGDGNITAWIC